MKLGLAIGQRETISFQVTEDMFAQFEGRIVHPVYSTVTMVYHMEWVSRKIILPFLEKDEEGVGASVKVKHIAPATLGTPITATAVVTKLDDRFVVTEVELSNGEEMIGKGEVVQVILPKAEIREKLAKSNNVKKA